MSAMTVTLLEREVTRQTKLDLKIITKASSRANYQREPDKTDAVAELSFVTNGMFKSDPSSAAS